MEQGKPIMILISCSLLFIIAVPFIIRLIRQFIAIKYGKQYISDRVHSDNSGRLFVDWTDENGVKHSKVFNAVKRNSRSLTEVKIFIYNKMCSLGKISVLGDVFMILIDISAIIYIIVYGLINL